MNHHRLPPVLRQLTEPVAAESRWRWSTARIDPSGRLLLSVEARRVLGAEPGTPTVVSGRVEQDALVLRAGPGAGRDLVVDRRGRLYVPVWLRRHHTVLIGACDTRAAVVIVSSGLLDVTGEAILERVR